MRVVAIETATDRLSVAGGEVGGPTVSRAFAGARRHAALLPGLVTEILEELGWAWPDVGAIAVSDGPGSFTGLRVGAAWVKGVSRGASIDVWTASTLMVRAAGSRKLGRVLAYASALRGELYVAGYRFDSAGTIETILAPAVLRQGDRLVAGFEPEYLVGDDTDLTHWPWTVGIERVAPSGWPEAADLIGLIRRPGGAIRVESLASWEPIYGRLAEAQARWEKAHGQPLPDSSRSAS